MRRTGKRESRRREFRDRASAITEPPSHTFRRQVTPLRVFHYADEPAEMLSLRGEILVRIGNSPKSGGENAASRRVSGHNLRVTAVPSPPPRSRLPAIASADCSRKVPLESGAPVDC